MKGLCGSADRSAVVYSLDSHNLQISCFIHIEDMDVFLAGFRFNFCGKRVLRVCP